MISSTCVSRDACINVNFGASFRFRCRFRLNTCSGRTEMRTRQEQCKGERSEANNCLRLFVSICKRMTAFTSLHRKRRSFQRWSQFFDTCSRRAASSVNPVECTRGIVLFHRYHLCAYCEKRSRLLKPRHQCTL